MKALYLILIVLSIAFVSACDKDDDHGDSGDLTGRSLEYPLLAGSEYNTSGTITFQEKKDKTLRAVIKIGPSGMKVYHPVHLHYGEFEMDAPMASMLHPVDGMTGEGITEQVILEDDTPLTFEELQQFDGHVKVHGDDEANKDLILAYGNIGANKSKPATPPSSYAIVLCK